jgi:3-hydroxyisobutyrate dehydrogenase-like beta-hydroxyacid dehydrogenase
MVESGDSSQGVSVLPHRSADRSAVRIAILGLGEAGRCYAVDLIAVGRDVAGYDPVPVATPAGLHRTGSVADAVAAADLVLGLTGARFAVAVAEAAAASLRAGACFADLNSAAPTTKRAVADALAGTGAVVADVAVLAPVPRQGAATPLLVSGPARAAWPTPSARSGRRSTRSPSRSARPPRGSCYAACS